MLKFLVQVKILLLTCLLIFLPGCSKEDPNPEIRDPIYRDLHAEFKEAEKALEDERKKLEGLEKELISTPVNTTDIKIVRKDIQKSKTLIENLAQKTRYLEIRAERRRVEGRREYKIAFQKGEEWPNPDSYKQYLINKKLRAAPRNWSARVPKLFNRDSIQKTEKKEAPKEE